MSLHLPVDREIYPNRTTTAQIKTRFFENPEIEDADKKSIKEFIQRQEAKGVRERRVIKTLSALTTVLTRISPGFRLTEAKEKELLELGEKIRKSHYAPNTQRDFFVILKRYFKVMEGRGKRLPEKCDFFEAPKKVTITKTPQDLISREEYSKLLGVCLNNRDRAAVSLLYESGLRCGELLSLRLCDVKFTDDGIDLHIPQGKTGPRDIWLIECLQYLKAWVDAHPLKDDKEAPIFVSLERHGRRQTHTRLDAYSLRAMLRKKAAKAGLLVSKIHPHAFRHTAATEKAMIGLTQPQLCAFFGWAQSSSMAAVYIHMTNREIKEAYRRALGLPTDETKAMKQCPKCGYANSYLAQECGRCGTTLDAKKRVREMDERVRQIIVFNVIMDKEPQFKADALRYGKKHLADIEQALGIIP